MFNGSGARHHRRHSRILALLLQCVPLLFVAGCLQSVALATRFSMIVGAVLSLSMMLSGLGYLYLREHGRYSGALAAGIAIWGVSIIVNVGLTFGCLDSSEVSGCYRQAVDSGTLEAVLTCTVVVIFVIYTIQDANRRFPRHRRSRRRGVAGEGPQDPT